MIDNPMDTQTEKQENGANQEFSSPSSKETESSPKNGTPERKEQEVDPIQALTEENKQVKDLLLRTAADFENYRKRTSRDLEDTRFQTKEKLLKEFLPVLDNLDRALTAAEGKSEGNLSSLLEGVRMVQRQFLQALEKSEIKSFEALGKPFDPQLHEAISQIDHPSLPSGTVASVLQRGYMSGTRLIRPALVAVVK